jgi:chemotaxis protein MotB
MAKKRRRRNRKGKLEYWQSYSDVMAALLIVFVLITMVTIGKMENIKQELLISQQTVEKQQILIKQLGGDSDVDYEKLQEMQEKVESIIGVKADIIKKLKKELDSDDLNIDSQTGAIQLDDEILFETKEYSLKKSGKKKLDKFLKAYFKVLLSDKYKNNIAEIIVEGHTDTRGGYAYNLELSQNRARSVVLYCLSSKNLGLSSKEKKRLQKMITANGRSYSNPILKKNGKIDMDKSRRVVFQFRLKDDEMIQELQDILSSDE